MARTYTFGRQQAEDLVDLLEDNPDFQLHDQTAFELAAELRELFGMCSHAESLKRMAEMAKADRSTWPKITINAQFYQGDFNTAFTPPTHKD